MTETKSEHYQGKQAMLNELTVIMKRLRMLWEAAQVIGIRNTEQRWLIEIVTKLLNMDYEGARRGLMFLLASQGYRTSLVKGLGKWVVVDVRDLIVQGAKTYMTIFFEFDVKLGPRPTCPPSTPASPTIYTHKYVYDAATNKVVVL